MTIPIPSDVAADQGNADGRFSDALDELRNAPEGRWTDVLVQIEEFQAFFVADRIPELRPAVCRVPNHDHDLDIPRSSVGVYLAFDPNERLVYVGLTRVSVEGRMKKHAKRFDCPYEDVIAIPRRLHWVACGLERFLIDSLKPPMNAR